MKTLKSITDEEAQTIYELIEKKYALFNLKNLLEADTCQQDLYNKCLNEYFVIENQYQIWWDNVIKKYHLEKYLDLQLSVNVVSKEIQLL